MTVSHNALKPNFKVIEGIMFRLLPIQILLAGINAVNGIVASLFATNFLGVQAMSAVALYGPINLFVAAVSTMFVGGSTILCGKYMGKNEPQKMQNVFSVDLIAASLVGAVFTLIVLILGLFRITGFLTQDAAVGEILGSYLTGQAFGILPFMLGSQFSAFLSLENQVRRTTAASLIYIGVNILLNFLFLKVLHMGAFGLALASSLGLWVFCGIQAQFFFTEKAEMHFSAHGLVWGEILQIVVNGAPGALGPAYLTARGLIVNGLISTYVGTAGLSAFGACNNLLALAWAVPGGMLTVSRLMFSVSIGAQDRQSVTDIMRVMFRRFLPMMCLIAAALILAAVPMTRLYFRDPSDPVYAMTVSGFRILPLAMPAGVITMHFSSYGETSGKRAFVYLISLLDGVVFVAGYTALLIPLIGICSVYIANVLNSYTLVLVILIRSVIGNRALPRSIEELMLIPENFGVPAHERIDISISGMEEVVRIAEQVQTFCTERGIDGRRAHLSGLAMEEMAGNVVGHGFLKDNKKHSVDVRVVHKDNDVILRITDDCVPFDPSQRRAITNPEDPTSNIGLRLLFSIAQDVQYQSILGMNVLTVRI